MILYEAMLYYQFRSLNQQPDDLSWLSEPVDNWPNNHHFLEFRDFVKNLHVVNDDAERLKIDSLML